MSYRIITDATADLSDKALEGLPKIDVVPMDVLIDNQSYKYGLNEELTPKQLYKELRSGKFGSTSQITPLVYDKYLRTAGAIQSATTSGQKFGQGIGSALIGFIMDANAYNGNLDVQPEQALQTIQNLFIYGVTVLGIIMIVILLFYKLDKEYPAIIRELLAREAKQIKKEKVTANE